MLFQVPDVLTAEELAQVTETLGQAEFIDGKLTAGWHAKLVKHNQQLAKTVPEAASLKQQIKTALNRHPLFQVAVRPKIIHSILFSRYTPGMSYGLHVDNALMAGHRSDVSFTVFLSAPEAYDGGELVIAGPDDEQGYRLAAGTALVYPSTSLHRVDPVTQGERLVAVGWAQSWVRDAAQRELLFDLETARRSLFAKDGKTPEFDLLSKSVANLLRRWCD